MIDAYFLRRTRLQWIKNGEATRQSMAYQRRSKKVVAVGGFLTQSMENWSNPRLRVVPLLYQCFNTYPVREMLHQWPTIVWDSTQNHLWSLLNTCTDTFAWADTNTLADMNYELYSHDFSKRLASLNALLCSLPMRTEYVCIAPYILYPVHLIAPVLAWADIQLCPAHSLGHTHLWLTANPYVSAGFHVMFLLRFQSNPPCLSSFGIPGVYAIPLSAPTPSGVLYDTQLLGIPHSLWTGYLVCSKFPVRSPTQLSIRHSVRSLGVCIVCYSWAFPVCYLELSCSQHPTLLANSCNLGQHLTLFDTWHATFPQGFPAGFLLFSPFVPCEFPHPFAHPLNRGFSSFPIRSPSLDTSRMKLRLTV